MTPAEQYQQELKQSEIDHHTPTAGAMTGHIIANLLLHSLKISQARFFARGMSDLFLTRLAPDWIAKEQEEFTTLSRLLVDRGESIPTTTDQFKEFAMIEEDGANKYRDGKEQLFQLVKDFDTQTLFITKAITLANKEDWPELQAALANLLGWINHQIAITQRFLDHDLREGLYSEEDDEDF